MRIRHQLKYDASPEDVYAMLSDPAFRQRVCAAMDTVSHDVAVDETDAGMSVRIDMVQHTHGVPGFAKKIVGDQTRIIQSEQWAETRAADLQVEIPGKPGHIRGRITLSGDASGTVEAFDGEATVSIPFVGGKLEGVIEKLFLKGMDTEQGVGAAWLAGER
ncbi:MAG TPA: DUF2505 domain-containing protein [Nocardioidaceae bacterium]|nr:DUF2505 domain-containing protein [Nocardioidaceae bacterium]